MYTRGNKNEALMNLVTGNALHEFRGVKTLLPVDVDADRMEGAIKGMTPQDLALAAVRQPTAPFPSDIRDRYGDVITPETILEDGILEYTAPNLYRIKKEDSNTYVLGLGGAPLIFDFTDAINAYNAANP